MTSWHVYEKEESKCTHVPIDLQDISIDSYCCHFGQDRMDTREMPPTLFGHLTFIKKQIHNIKNQCAMQEHTSQKENMNHAMWHDEHEHVMMMQCNGLLVEIKKDK